MNHQPIEILMVEDNPGDIELTREAFLRGKFANNLYVAEDGEEALDFLYQRGKFNDAPRPDIILLDLNLPKLGGRDILATIKKDKELASIPVIILSSSQDANDVQATYALNANSFVTKPVQIEDFLRVAQAIEHFWVQIVKLPSGKN